MHTKLNPAMRLRVAYAELKHRGRHCTNLIPQCGANAQRLLSLPNLDARLGRWVRDVAANLDMVQPCQGDVSVVIDSSGNTNVEREFQNACLYRGEYAGLGLTAP